MSPAEKENFTAYFEIRRAEVILGQALTNAVSALFQGKTPAPAARGFSQIWLRFAEGPAGPARRREMQKGYWDMWDMCVGFPLRLGVPPET